MCDTETFDRTVALAVQSMGAPRTIRAPLGFADASVNVLSLYFKPCRPASGEQLQRLCSLASFGAS